MARNKMEKEFSEKLSQRQIQPSAAAWDRLDAMLAASESQTPVMHVKRNYKWLYIAASFLGFLLIGTLFFRKADAKNSATENADKQVVEAQAQPKAKHASETPDVEVAQVPDRTQTESPKTAAPMKQTTANPKFSQKSQLAYHRISHQSQSNPVVVASESGIGAINQKTNTLNQTDTQIASGATADELLAAAQARRESEAQGAKVSARSLLSQVDSQAEEKLTLKQKAMRALNKNYQHVKVAVENRNIEENH